MTSKKADGIQATDRDRDFLMRMSVEHARERLVANGENRARFFAGFPPKPLPPRRRQP